MTAGITLAEADEIIAAAKAYAKSIGVAVAIAVVDTRGDLIAVTRMDESAFYAVDTARGREMGAARCADSSKAVADGGLASHIYQSFGALRGQGRMVIIQGGVLVKRRGEVVGAVAASGAAPEQDEEAANAGAGALE